MYPIPLLAIKQSQSSHCDLNVGANNHIDSINVRKV